MTEFRIYAPDVDLFALVDEVDYQWAIRWRWSPKWSRGGTKVYLRRVFSISSGGEIVDGQWRRIRRQTTIFLHREILIRAKGPPPDEHRIICDHRNGDEMDCRRKNLRWATHSMNACNVNQNSAAIRRRLYG